MFVTFCSAALASSRAPARRVSMPVRRWYWQLRSYVSQRELLFFHHDGSTWLKPVAGNGPEIAISGAGPQVAGIAQSVADRSGMPLAVVHARLRAGCKIVHASTPDAGLLAWGWIMLPGLAMSVGFEADLNLEVGNGLAYVFDFVTASAVRGQGLYRQLLDYAAHYCLGHGAVCVGIYCRAENVASRRGIVAAGFQGEQKISLLRLGPLVRLRASGRSWWCRVRGSESLANLLKV